MLVSALAGCGASEPPEGPVPRVAAPVAPLTVTSTDFIEGGTLPLVHAHSGFGCVGSNRSPALGWEATPGALSYALTLFDPDAPGGGWWHWTVANLPPSTTALPAGAGGRRGRLPEGAVQGRTDFGSAGYGGPCPPAGDAPHRYVFTVHALDVATLPVTDTTDGAAFAAMARPHIIASGTITGRFGR